MTNISDTIVQEITINGSAERIFEALTNPGQRVRWWGAEGRFQTTHMESDLRLGGADLARTMRPTSGMSFGPMTVLLPSLEFLASVASMSVTIT